MEKTIEIPEGYEARIEGNKVILERKESEDEIIRNRIIWYLKQDIEEHPEREERINEMLAYLERQKEQKPVDSMQLSNDGFTPKDIFRFNLASCLYNYGKEVAAKCLDTHILDEELNEYVTMHDVNKVVENSIELLQRNAMTQKPAEWREEDEKTLDATIQYIGNTIPADYDEKEITVKSCKDWLTNRVKSLRPSWKPSEEDFAELIRIKDSMPNNEWGNQAEGALDELIENLKKL